MERASTRTRLGVGLRWQAVPPFWRATIGGILGTFAMTIWIYVTQVFGISQLEVARALGMIVGNASNAVLIGTGLHLAIGVLLGIVYAYGFSPLLPGPAWVRGLVYSLLPTSIVVVFLPLAAWGLLMAGVIAFGPAVAAMWLVNQVVYGVVLGFVYGIDD